MVHVLSDSPSSCLTATVQRTAPAKVQRSIHASPEVAQNVVEAIARHPKTHYQESYFHFHLLSDVDKDDNKFVDCAIAASANYIVTEDNHFNRLKSLPYPKLKILTLDEFNTIDRES